MKPEYSKEVISSWEEAQDYANALLDWLGEHCPACGNEHTDMCVDGGRCMFCGHMLCAISSLKEALEETSLIDH